MSLTPTVVAALLADGLGQRSPGGMQSRTWNHGPMWRISPAEFVSLLSSFVIVIPCAYFCVFAVLP